MISAFGVEDSRLSKADDGSSHKGAWIGGGLATAGLVGAGVLAHKRLTPLPRVKPPTAPFIPHPQKALPPGIKFKPPEGELELRGHAPSEVIVPRVADPLRLESKEAITCRARSR